MLVHRNDATRIAVVPMHNGKTLPPGTLRAILKGARVSIEDAARVVVGTPMSCETNVPDGICTLFQASRVARREYGWPHETQEDFYAQELPVALLALRGEYPITPRLHLLATVDGGFLPKIDSLRTEGGKVNLAQEHADVVAGLRYAVTPHLLAYGGYDYTYFSQHETGGEDSNKIVFLGHGFGVALTYLF
jgi:hypothetical protein